MIIIMIIIVIIARHLLKTVNDDGGGEWSITEETVEDQVRSGHCAFPLRCDPKNGMICDSPYVTFIHRSLVIGTCHTK